MCGEENGSCFPEYISDTNGKKMEKMFRTASMCQWINPQGRWNSSRCRPPITEPINALLKIILGPHFPNPLKWKSPVSNTIKCTVQHTCSKVLGMTEFDSL